MLRNSAILSLEEKTEHLKLSTHQTMDRLGLEDYLPRLVIRLDLQSSRPKDSKI